MSSAESFEQHPADSRVADIQEDIAKKERTIKGVESLEQHIPGSSAVSPERLQAMREAVADERRHLEELLEHNAGMHRARPVVEDESRYVNMTEQVLREAEELEREMRVFYKHRDEPGMLSLYRKVREKMLALRDRYEDASKAVATDHPIRASTTPEEQRIQDTFVRMLEMEVPVVGGRPEAPWLLPDAYDKHVEDILADVDGLKTAFEFAIKKGLTPQKLQMLNDGLDAAQEKLQELDTQTENPAQSKERKHLMQLINSLRAANAAQSLQHEPGPMETGELTAVRGMYARVKATYASAQHTLTVDQRRQVRSQIAQLASLVRRAEDERLAGVGSAVLAAVSHAAEHAPAVAHAAVSSMRAQHLAQKGPLATLASAFRLKN